MNESANDFHALRHAILSVRFKHLFWAAFVIGVLAVLNYYVGISIDTVDRNNYKAVAEQYIYHNAVIARTLGKVSRISHIGVGGDGSPKSYNTFSVRGTDKSGACYCTLTRDETGDWYVTDAILSSQGREYTLPVRRTGKVPFKLFGD